MLNKNLFTYEEERQEAIACRNIHLWHQLYRAELAEEQARRDYYHQKFLDDDHNRCLGEW